MTGGLPVHATAAPLLAARQGPVAVGFTAATRPTVLRAAAFVANLLGRDVVLVHAVASSAQSTGDVVAAAAAAARLVRDQIGPGHDVTATAVPGSPVGALLDAAARATVLVLGSDHDDGFDEVVHLDVLTHVATHALCPVLVVHGTRPADARANDGTTARHDRVVVAADDLASSTTIALAAKVAVATGRRLEVMSAPVAPTGPGGASRALVDVSAHSFVLVLQRPHLAPMSNASRIALREALCPVLVVPASG